jgi:RNA polymerase sigma-70 factor (ECF subfamily)
VQSRNLEPASAAEFAVFMRRHQDVVYSTAVRLLGNDAQAEDIAQEVFVRAYQNFEGLRDHPTAPGWLRTVARNLCLNHITRYRRRWRFFSEYRNDDDPDDDETEPEFAVPDQVVEDVEGADRRERLEEALRQLPEQQRVPLVLFHFEDVSYAEISSRLGISLAKLKTDMHRGRQALARSLGGMEL